MEILKDFGVNWVLLLAQVVNFLLVFIILKKVLYKPFLSMLKKREEIVKQGVKQAEEAKLLLEEAKAQEHKMLKKAQEQASKIISDAKLETREQALAIEENTKAAAEKIMKMAEEKIEHETKDAEVRLRKDIARIAVAILEKTLPDVLDKKSQEEILRKATSNLKLNG